MFNLITNVCITRIFFYISFRCFANFLVKKIPHSYILSHSNICLYDWFVRELYMYCSVPLLLSLCREWCGSGTNNRAVIFCMFVKLDHHTLRGLGYYVKKFHKHQERVMAFLLGYTKNWQQKQQLYTLTLTVYQKASDFYVMSLWVIIYTEFRLFDMISWPRKRSLFFRSDFRYNVGPLLRIIIVQINKRKSRVVLILIQVE